MRPLPFEKLPALSAHSGLYLLCYLLIVVGIWLRIDYIFQHNPLDHIWSDPQRHWEQGTEVLRNDPMSLTDPVLYQIYIGVLGKLTLKSPLLVAFYTALLSILTPWIWYRFARELLRDRLIATGLWAALCMLPSWIAIYSYFMQETLLLPLLGAALYTSWRCKRKQTVASFVLMALLWCMAGLTRGIAIPLAAVACTWLWLIQGQKIQKAAYSLLLLALILGPLSYRAYDQTRLLAPHGIGQMVAIYTRSGKREIHINYRRDGARWGYWFGSPSTGATPFEPLSDWRSARDGRVQVDVDLRKGSEDWNKALAANPLTFKNYFWLTGENLIFLFFGPSWPDNNLERTLERINHHSRWLWAPLTLALLIGIALHWQPLRGRRLLPVLLLTWIVVQGLLPISVNEGRYRKPGEGILIVQVALLLAVRRRREGKQGEQAAAQETESYASTNGDAKVLMPVAIRDTIADQAVEGMATGSRTATAPAKELHTEGEENA